MVAHYLDLPRTIPNFPKPGIDFIDIGPLVADWGAMKHVVHHFRLQLQQHIWVPDYLVALDARGFLFASHLGAAIDTGVLMCRKAGKLPGDVVTTTYRTEYSESSFQMQQGLARPGSKVVLVDDILATGGSLNAAALLSEQLELNVLGALVFADITGLKDHPDRPKFPVASLMKV